ncbi:TonB-dependent receptor [uncultured Porticoccus sp.]|uniref:TonB-dependent receptor n=1 Tax=uncultured Porticoccus sp. TaxID=1256050 RepID=UPI00262A4763|nr:TonB-dependent receptor [uncultured Porticoccus sp.]
MKKAIRWASALVVPYLFGLSTISVHAEDSGVEGAGATAVVASLEEVKVWGKQLSSREAGYTNPTSVLTREDMASINVATTEDLVKYEPSLVIRRRFIGDANGTLGIRGSNMFQTSRSMVFADGVPLHYFLESRWNGAPRWTLVSASEIAQVEVVYGPFSAEHSGNAMGGVVLIETAIPQQREFHVDWSSFVQSFDEYGFDDDLWGRKGFISFGDKIGNLSVYLSYNRLENDAQPQSFYYGSSSSSLTPTAVSGAIGDGDDRGADQWYFGDTGMVKTTTDNYKFKAGYDLGDWFALLNVAYEDRRSDSDSANSYLRDIEGNTVWGGHVVQNGEPFFVPASRLNVSEQDRRSLSVGLRLKGDLTDSLSVETNLSHFAIIEDETRSSALNPAHPDYTLAGQVLDYGDTGWQTADIKFTLDGFGLDGMQWVAGLRYETYELNTTVYNSDNYVAGDRARATSRSGGETGIAAAFLQLNWDIDAHWSTSLGGRYESWKSSEGYFSDDDALTPWLDLVKLPSRSEDKFSPKFSLGFRPDHLWTLRYSIAKAYRFPIVEELFSQFQAFNAVSEANPGLQPEDGLHHNLMVERAIDRGYVRLNLFLENIKDVIESQATVLPGGSSIRTFVPVDEVRTRGAEFIVNAADFLLPKLDVRFNMAWTDAEVIKNAPDPAIVGNLFPRMPKWRGNLLATYHVTYRWDIGGSLQYASDSYGRLDNSDGVDQVFGGQDRYLFLGLKTSFRRDKHLTFSLGMDNVTDETAYVAHPWPARTLYFNVSYDW